MSLADAAKKAGASVSVKKKSTVKSKSTINKSKVNSAPMKVESEERVSDGHGKTAQAALDALMGLKKKGALS
jgi:hypothetical protein